MEFFQEWLLGVLGAALAVGAVERLCPEGSARALVRFTGALVLLLAMLRPLAVPGLPETAWDAAGYREAVAALELELAGERDAALSGGIAEALAAYIEDEAERLGAPVRAEVETETRGGVPAPARVTLRGAYSEAVSAFLASELGVPREKQKWIGS